MSDRAEKGCMWFGLFGFAGGACIMPFPGARAEDRRAGAFE